MKTLLPYLLGVKIALPTIHGEIKGRITRISLVAGDLEWVELTRKGRPVLILARDITGPVT